MIDESEIKFIQSNFKIRTCNTYKGKSFEICVCNRPKSEHKYFPALVEEWSYDRNTVHLPCDTFGEISFTGFDEISNPKLPKFIRFDYLYQPMIYECVYKLLVNSWGIPLPKLIISINGGFKRMNFKTNKIKKNFKQGLIDVIKKDNTWIIGGGFNVGIHQLVSEAVHEYRLHQENSAVTLIGISSWGVVYNNKALLAKPETKDAHKPSRRYQYGNNVSNEKGKVALDPHYDCYLFCDDGTDRLYDREVDFRMNLENYAVQQDNSFIVQILFEGGKRALLSAYNTLKNKVNVVVIKGSGRAANILSEALELTNHKFMIKIDSILEEYKEQLSVDTEEINELKIILTDMHTNYKKQIIIHDMDDPSLKLDKSILEAIISGRDEKDLKKTLQLTIRFNCPNIADKKVFLNTNYPTIKARSITKMFLEVLEQNKFEFVRLFLQNGLEIESVMSKDVLEKLYVESMRMKRNNCFDLLTDLVGEENVTLQKIGTIIPSISGNILKIRYKQETPRRRAAAIIQIEMRPSSNPGSPHPIPFQSDVTSQDLLLWALLSGHIELAEIFWKIGKDRVGSALIASTILKNMATLTLKQGDIDLEMKLRNASQKFQDYATNIVCEAYYRSKSKTYDMLVRALKRWDRMTCIQIAVSGGLLDFLNNSACSSYATKVWMGNMSPFLSYWKILINIPFSLIFIKLLIIPFINDEHASDLPLNYHAPQRKKPIPLFKAIKTFYSAPIVKFTINIISYIMFLIVFSYMNLSELKYMDNIFGAPLKEIWAEIFVCIYVVSIIIEEIRQVIDQERSGNIIYKFIAYLSGSWNIYDMVLILLFIISVIVRYTINKQNFGVCRCLFSASLSMFCLRTMQFYFVNKSIGPKVIMIRDMIRDILFFLSIFGIFILSFGTLAQALKNPNSAVNLNLLRDIVYLPYFQTYGELMLDKIEIECNGTICMVVNGTITIGFAIFLLLTNVLLINLLIAMFGYTFNQIQESSGKHWSFIRMQLIEEFYEKPILPPPLNLIYYFFKGFFLFFNKVRCRPQIIQNNLLVKSLTDNENIKICGFEQFCMEAFLSEEVTLTNSATSEIEGWFHDIADLFDIVLATPDVSQSTKKPKFHRTLSVQKSHTKRSADNLK